MLLKPIAMMRSQAGGAPHVPNLVDNQGTASLTRSGGLAASDSSYMWMAGVFNFQNSSGRLLDVDGRSTWFKTGNFLVFEVKSTSNTLLFDGNLGGMTTGVERHIYMAYDGVAGTFEIYVDGVNETSNLGIDVAATTGTVDMTRSGGGNMLSNSFDLHVGDFLFGTNAPPGISAVYDGGYKDVSGVSADVNITGTATEWNGDPDGFTTSGTFVDL